VASALSDNLDAAKVARCVVVGNSLGGGVALMLAASARERERALRLRMLRMWGAAEMMTIGAGAAARATVHELDVPPRHT
jgi:pimeloyl-ACP methyl ester carboxylesterase